MADVRRFRAAHSLATARTGHQSGEQREINSRPIAREQRLIVIGVGHISKSATNQLKQRRHLKRYFGAAMALARLSFVLLPSSVLEQWCNGGLLYNANVVSIWDDRRDVLNPVKIAYINTSAA